MFQPRGILYDDREDAGLTLVPVLEQYKREDVVVLGIPRGGIPVAAPVAEALEAELDVIVVKKLGAPGNPELAIGAVGEDGEPYLNQDVVASLSVDQEYLTSEARKKHSRVKELLSEFRDVKPKSELEGRTVILVDDGIATGATTRACLEIIERETPKALVLAVPVAPAKAIETLRRESPVDRVVCPHAIDGFFGGIGGYYRNFGQVTSETVRSILRRFSSRERGNSPGE